MGFTDDLSTGCEQKELKVISRVLSRINRSMMVPFTEMHQTEGEWFCRQVGWAKSSDLNMKHPSLEFREVCARDLKP